MDEEGKSEEASASGASAEGCETLKIREEGEGRQVDDEGNPFEDARGEEGGGRLEGGGWEEGGEQ